MEIPYNEKTKHIYLRYIEIAKEVLREMDKKEEENEQFNKCN